MEKQILIKHNDKKDFYEKNWEDIYSLIVKKDIKKLKNNEAPCWGLIFKLEDTTQIILIFRSFTSADIVFKTFQSGISNLNYHTEEIRVIR